jgi:hypothetical protein
MVNRSWHQGMPRQPVESGRSFRSETRGSAGVSNPYVGKTLPRAAGIVDLLATDHRIAADVESTEDELKCWASKSFWLPSSLSDLNHNPLILLNLRFFCQER